MGSSTWFEWLTGLFAALRPPPVPGSHEAVLEELRVVSLLNKELRKPPGDRDEELVWNLRAQAHKRQLENVQVTVNRCDYTATLLEKHTCRPPVLHCCWITEELAAAKARRPAVIAAQPTLHLTLPAALQQQPPRLDLCSECARWLEQLELAEQSCRVHAEVLLGDVKLRGRQAAPAAAAASQGAAGSAAAAAEPPVGEAQQAQQQQVGGDSSAGGREGAPATPKQEPPALPQLQHPFLRP